MRKIDLQLFNALKDEDPAPALKLLRQGADPRVKGPFGLTSRELVALLRRSSLLTAVGLKLEQFVPFQEKSDTKVRITPIRELEAKLGWTYWPWMFFDSWNELVDVINHCPRWLSSWMIGRHYRWLGAMSRPYWAEGKTSYVGVRYVDDDMGYGLFAEEEIKKDTIVGVYAGRVSDTDKVIANDYCLRYPKAFLTFRKWHVDAQDEGGLLRFVNHSDTPNLLPEYACWNRLAFPTFTALVDIPKGQQLFFDYGKHYWRARQHLKKA